MYDPYIVKRTQIYLHEEQANELTRRSQARGVTASNLIREAVEQYLAGPDDETTELARQRALLREAFGVLPQLPDGRTFVEQARRDEATRAEELESRWRGR